MTVNVPADNAERVGLRKVIDEEAVKKVVKYLTSGGTEMPKNWNRRFKHNRDKMKTGDIYELAEVVRNLSLRDGEKGLSTGEKQMYVKAKKILASELMYAKNMTEDEALEWLEETLREGAKPKVAAEPAKRAAPVKKPCRSSEEDDRRGQEACREETGGRALTMSVWAVLVAAGRGERLGEDRPKAFVALGELPLLAEPLRRLDESGHVDAVVVVAPPGWEEPTILLAEELGASKVSACVPGGATRTESVRAGIAEVPEDAAVVLVHDAARPLVPDEVIGRGCSRRSARGSTAPCRRCRSATLSSASTATSSSRRSTAPSSSRSRHRRRSWRPSSVRRCERGEGSDCASLVEAAGGRVKVVPGDERLLKVTTRSDLERIAAWL